MELQAYRIYTRRDEGAWGYCPLAEPTDVELNDEQVYIKSEADRYIARQKYKRCLTMARMCSSYRFAWSFIPEDDEVHKSNFYKKWELRWLILSDKFKEDL